MLKGKNGGHREDEQRDACRGAKHPWGTGPATAVRYLWAGLLQFLAALVWQSNYFLIQSREQAPIGATLRVQCFKTG